jgi:RNA polymerase sigma-70 factor (ECF subfamily)
MAWDQALLQRFRNGEANAMAEVYRSHVGSLTRILRAAAFRGAPVFTRLRNPHELDNVLLEVFARAFEPRARQAYDGQRGFELFLMGIARNVLLEEARVREDAVGLELSALVDEALPAELSDLHVQLEDRELDGLLDAFKRELGADERKLFELRYVEQLGQEASAQQLGQTRIQLRRREQKLRSSLLEFLKRRGYLEDRAASGWSFAKGDA